MEELSVLACPREPPRDGRLTVAEDSFGRGWVEPFGQSREYHGDLVRGGFQTRQGRVVSSAECGVTGLATKGLDLLSSTMLAIPDESVHSRVSVAKVRAPRFGQANPSVSIRLGAPRRLFTSHQGRTGADAGPLPDEGAEARRQVGQSCGERGLSRRGSAVRTLAALDLRGPGWGQHRAQSSASKKMSKSASRNTWTFMKHSLGLK